MAFCNGVDPLSSSSLSSFEIVSSVPPERNGSETSSWENVSSHGAGDGSSLSSSSSSSTSSDMVLVEMNPSFGRVDESSSRHPDPHVSTAGLADHESNSEGGDDEEKSSDASMYDEIDDEEEDVETSSNNTAAFSIFRHMDNLQLQSPSESQRPIISEMHDMALGPAFQGDSEVIRGARALQSYVHLTAVATTLHLHPRDDDKPESTSVPWQKAAANSSGNAPTNNAAKYHIGTNSAAVLSEVGQDAGNLNPMCAPSVCRMWDGRVPPNSLSSSFQPPCELLFQGSSAYRALEYAKEKNKLLVVSIQDYSQFGSHIVNRDILRNDCIQELIKSEYVLLQTTIHDKIGLRYINQFQVKKFPHMGVIHPTHKSMIWGIEGWTAENPWLPIQICESLVEIRFDRFPEGQLAMNIDCEEATGGWGTLPEDPITNVAQEIETQDAIETEMRIWLHDTQDIEFLLEMQSALLQSHP
jgi:hypothetical protein